jgi:hypothetical protein
LWWELEITYIITQTNLYAHIFTFLSFPMLGIEPRALHALGKNSTTEQHPPAHMYFLNVFIICQKQINTGRRKSECSEASEPN